MDSEPYKLHGWALEPWAPRTLNMQHTRERHALKTLSQTPVGKER